MKTLIFTVLLVLKFYGILSVRQRRYEKDEVESLIDSSGYLSEVHEVETEDEYRIKIHRISPSFKVERSLPPVFFMHGLFATAADYLMTGPNIALRT